MIPSSLRMRNFMCYREAVPALNFDGIHVACLCGDNGSGKSAIFDAITWALWGKASRGRNEDIISTGRNEMEVELEFYNGDNHYRIIRKFNRSSGSKSSQVMLDLQVIHESRYQSIAEHIVKDTQEKINRLLHLDYATFTNSALLLQGKANEFSIKIPSERKDILSRILDLTFYDELEADAKAEAEKNRNAYAVIERELQTIDQKAAEKPGLETALKQVQDSLAGIEQNMKTVETELQDLRQKKEALAARDEQFKLIQKQIAGKAEDMQAAQTRLDAALKNIQRFNNVISGAVDIERGYAVYQDLAAREMELNARFRQYHDLTQRKNRIENLIASLQNALNSERKGLAVSISELEKRCGQTEELKKKQEELVRQQTQLVQSEADLTARQKLIKDTTGLISSISAVNSQLMAAMEEIRRKMAMISHASAVCPLCERELGPDEHRRISHKLELELQQNVSATRENTKKIALLKVDLSTIEKEARDIEAWLRAEREKCGRQATLIEKALNEADKASAELAEKRPRLEQIEASLKDRSFAAAEFKELDLVDQEIRKLDYDQTRHEKITRDKNNAVKYELLFKELNEARLRIEQEERTAADNRTVISRLQSEIAALKQETDLLAIDLAGLPAIINQLKTAEEKQRTLQAEERKVRDHAAQLRENIRQIDALKEEKKDKEHKLRKHKEAESIYAELARCFSKKGIQALIISEALPEISNEANDLLGRMTDNRMSLRLEAQKTLKKGDQVETLDILISDEMGFRNYEMYSGGEAFRIDLALRIAISRLLVRRAGASMPILIIDEGFGTQDSASLEKLIDAINYIQDDFEKIFIITHLEELRDKFPVIINVTKTGEGSTISISQ